MAVNSEYLASFISIFDIPKDQSMQNSGQSYYLL